MRAHFEKFGPRQFILAVVVDAIWQRTKELPGQMLHCDVRECYLDSGVVSLTFDELLKLPVQGVFGLRPGNTRMVRSRHTSQDSLLKIEHRIVASNTRQ